MNCGSLLPATTCGLIPAHTDGANGMGNGHAAACSEVRRCLHLGGRGRGAALAETQLECVVVAPSAVQLLLRQRDLFRWHASTGAACRLAGRPVLRRRPWSRSLCHQFNAVLTATAARCLDEHIIDVAASPRFADQVNRLGCLRGISALTTAGISPYYGPGAEGPPLTKFKTEKTPNKEDDKPEK